MPRELFLPGPHAPHWMPGGQPPGGLLYLAWGRRQYGLRPIPLRLHHGWTYMIVLSGSPVFLAGARAHKVARGALLIAGPDVPYGWTDRRNGECDLLVWVWVRPPELDTRVNERTCWIRGGDSETLAELEDLHRRTRKEIQHPDARSPGVLAALQGLVDTACARSGARAGDGTARERQRLQLAEEWMRRHFEARAPAGALADYLGLSPMSLQRLFRQSAGMPPGKAFLQLKMREAATMLRRPGTSVKEVALTLGYRHPGDFTRAFTRFHGHPPSQVSDPAAVSGGDRLRHASRNPEKGRSPHGSDMSAAGAP